MAIRTAEVEWTGDFHTGQGRIAPASEAFTADYCYESIAGDGAGTNPTEMLAAAVASCVSSTLALALGTAGFQPKKICTRARAHLENVGGTYSITRIELHTTGEVAGIDEATFCRYAERTARTCPIGKAVSSVELILSAELL